jgi:hypothetical protein
MGPPNNAENPCASCPDKDKRIAELESMLRLHDGDVFRREVVEEERRKYEAYIEQIEQVAYNLFEKISLSTREIDAMATILRKFRQ